MGRAPLRSQPADSLAQRAQQTAGDTQSAPGRRARAAVGSSLLRSRAPQPAAPRVPASSPRAAARISLRPSPGWPSRFKPRALTSLLQRSSRSLTRTRLKKTGPDYANKRRTCREPLSRSGAPDVTRATSAGSPESPDLPGNARGGGTKRGRRHSASPAPSSPRLRTTLGDLSLSLSSLWSPVCICFHSGSLRAPDPTSLRPESGKKGRGPEDQLGTHQVGLLLLLLPGLFSARFRGLL